MLTIVRKNSKVVFTTINSFISKENCKALLGNFTFATNHRHGEDGHGTIQVTGIPTLVLFSPEGKILEMDLKFRGEEW